MDPNRRRKKSRFAGIPHRVIENSDYKTLSPTALRLLIKFAYDFNGRNNGKLCAPFSQVEMFGVKSEASLAKGLNELLQKNFIMVTRASSPYNRKNAGRTPVFYAITWEKIDEIRDFEYDLGVEPMPKAPRSFVGVLDSSFKK